ncbi:MAG: M14 family zinc carboxypeptidase [Planctomycetota bacterium]
MRNENDSAFAYPYEKVFDYNVIRRGLWEEAPPPAYTPQMVSQHTEAVSRTPWVQPTRSCQEGLVLGQTNGWPINPEFPDDPEIPSQNIYAYQITDPAGEPEVKMVIASGNHPAEFSGNWLLEGMVNFLAGDDDRAAALRKKAIFFVYPDVNPDGRYQAVHRIDLEAAPSPDPSQGFGKRFDGFPETTPGRGNAELYAAGEGDHNRVWNTSGRFRHIDLIKQAMKADTGGKVDYVWDFHGPQEPGNWRSPQGESAWNCPYGRALQAREPEVVVAGLPNGFKSGLFENCPPGKLSVWTATKDGLRADYTYVYEPGGWTEKRLKEAGRNLALALYDALEGNIELSGSA